MLIIREISEETGMRTSEFYVKAEKIAYDNCHKIYVLEDDLDEVGARNTGYDILDIKELPKVYHKSCNLRFISNWKLTQQYVRQCYNAEFVQISKEENILNKVIEVEDYNGNTLMSFMVDSEGDIIRMQDCSVADVDSDYIFDSDKDLIRIQSEVEDIEI